MRVGLRATSGWGVVLGACLLAACGDVTGNPIRSITTSDAGLHALDGGHDTVDAMSGATLPAPGNFPPMNAPGTPNQGPGSVDTMHDGHGNDVVPYTLHCAPVRNWSGAFASDEEQMEQAIESLRDQRVSCGNGIEQVRLPPLTFAPELRCSARLHSLDMYVADYYGAQGSDGSSPGDRMQSAGFEHGAVAESIAMSNHGDPVQVLLDLLDNPDDCANLASRRFTAVGVGEYAGLWTFDFAAAP